MLIGDPLQAECLSLVASLYGAVTDNDRFQVCRADCDAWLERQTGPESPAVAFLRLQVRRAIEARNLAAAGRSTLPTACAVLTVDDRGRLLAASPETWGLVGSGPPEAGPLRLPLALRAFVEDAGLSPSVPKALRVPLDDGSAELAGIVLGVDQVSHVAGTMRVITLLLCDVGMTEARQRPGGGRAEVREFRRVARDREPAKPFAVTLAADRSA
jgi:hypothetical protein